MGEIFTIRNEIGLQKDYSIDIELENLESDSGQLIGDISIRTQSNTIFQKGDILFGKLRPYLNKWWLADRDGIKSGEIWALQSNENYSNEFTYRIVQSNKFLNAVQITSGTKMPRAEWKGLKDLDVSIPTLAEQIAIGNFFKQLDETIDLHQRKIEKYQFIKQLYLEKMFMK